MKNAIKLLFCLMLTVLMLAGCCDHDWEEANCEQPRTCSACGETEGEKGDHDYEKATCQQPKTCSVCGKEKGDLGDHKWKDATCTEPETCRYCGETQGEAAGHRWAGLECQECGETRESPAATAPAAEGPAEDPSLNVYPEEFLLAMLEYTLNFSDSYAMGVVLEDTDDLFSCYLNYGSAPSHKVILLLDPDTGSITRATVQQQRDDVPAGNRISLYTMQAFMGVTDLKEVLELDQRIQAHMTTQDVREGEVYEVYELDGYYIQAWRRGTDEQHTYEVEIFRVS